jgi:predicted anti-sigma-YlaC factor YlaD
MSCREVRRLFGAYWDDDTTQAEREWLDAHLSSCASCRREYEELARVLEWTTTLPRVEASPDLVERTLARARRAATAADRIPRPSVAWVPVTAMGVLLLIAGILISPWIGWGPRSRIQSQVADRTVVREPVLVPTPTLVGQARTPAAGPVAAVPDSLFDHAEDVEFILDPVTLKRGRATVTRAPRTPQGGQAIITF